MNSLTQDHAKLFQNLKSGFERTINWNKYQSKAAVQVPNPYLDYIIGPSFQGVSRIFLFLFENNTDSGVHAIYYLPSVEIKDHNVIMMDKTFSINQEKTIEQHMIKFKRYKILCHCSCFIKKTQPKTVKKS